MKLLLLVDENMTRARSIKKNFDRFEKRINPGNVFEEVHIVDTPLYYSGITELGKKTYLYSTKRLFGIGYITVIFKIAAIIKKEKINIIKINYSKFLGLWAIFFQWAYRIPCVAGCYNDYRSWRKYFPFDRIFVNLFLEKFVYRHARFVLYQSRFMMNYLQALGVRQERFKLCYVMNTDVDNFLNVRHSADPRFFTLVFCGRLHNQKDVWTLLRAYKILKESRFDARLWLIGDGPLRLKLEAFVKDNAIKDVLFYGFLENSVIASLYAQADLFVFTTLFEGFPNVLIEAQAAGLPIVTTDIPHVSEIVSSNDAYLFKVKNHLELSGILNRLYRNEPELNRLRQASRKRSEEFLKKDIPRTNSKAYRDIYNESREK